MYLMTTHHCIQVYIQTTQETTGLEGRAGHRDIAIRL